MRGVLIFLAIIIVSFILLFITYKYYKKYTETDVNRLIIENIYSTKNLVIDNNKINSSYDGITYSLVLDINITDYYENYGYWRHIFHKGNQIIENKFEYFNEDYSGWDDLVLMNEVQNPGLWLHPTKNYLRFCLETGSNTIEQTKQIEYIDVEVATNTLIKLGIIVYNNQVIIYKNGKLVKIKQLKGVPEFNKGDLYFNIDKTYSGLLSRFIYYPYIITDSKMKSLI